MAAGTGPGAKDVRAAFFAFFGVLNFAALQRIVDFWQPKAPKHRQDRDTDQKECDKFNDHNYIPNRAHSALSSTIPIASAAISVPNRRRIERL